MAPQLFDLQLADGAWGITAAIANHVAVYRKFGIERILLANQLIGASAIEYLCKELKEHPSFDFYCLVDSERHLDLLLSALRSRAVGRPLQLLLEIGMPGGRCGVRDAERAIALGRRIKAAEPLVSLRGVEAFEGVVGVTGQEGRARVADLLGTMAGVAAACDEEGLFRPGEVVLTAGARRPSLQSRATSSLHSRFGQ